MIQIITACLIMLLFAVWNGDTAGMDQLQIKYVIVKYGAWVVKVALLIILIVYIIIF